LVNRLVIGSVLFYLKLKSIINNSIKLDANNPYVFKQSYRVPLIATQEGCIALLRMILKMVVLTLHNSDLEDKVANEINFEDYFAENPIKRVRVEKYFLEFLKVDDTSRL